MYSQLSSLSQLEETQVRMQRHIFKKLEKFLSNFKQYDLAKDKVDEYIYLMYIWNYKVAMESYYWIHQKVSLIIKEQIVFLSFS